MTRFPYPNLDPAKKPAAALFGASKVVKTKKNPLFEANAKTFSFGT
jgi:large subunit ribosomal protein L7Ae